VRGKALLTPPLTAGALYGITRGVVLELGRDLGLEVAETNLTRYDLFNADECFLTGTGAELIPWSRLTVALSAWAVRDRARRNWSRSITN